MPLTYSDVRDACKKIFCLHEWENVSATVQFVNTFFGYRYREISKVKCGKCGKISVRYGPSYPANLA